VLQSVAECCSVVQCGAVWCDVVYGVITIHADSIDHQCVEVCCSVLQCIVVCCGAL